MFEGLLMASLMLTDPAASAIQSAIEQYQHVTSYQLRLKSTSNGKTEIIRYYFRRPGYVRMEFIQPLKGAVLIYDPSRKDAMLWPLGYRSIPEFTLSPENHLIQSSTGQRVDRSDIGALYRNVKALLEHGKAEAAGIETAGEKEALHITIEGSPGYSVDAVHCYQLWLDQATAFPVKVSSYDAAGELIETVEMDELQLNPKFPGDFFEQ